MRCSAGRGLANDPETLVAEVLKAGEAPEVAIEATYGWYWAVDALQAAGANVHLVAPSKVGVFGGRRVKNDQRDCQLLGDLLRANMLPEAWISTLEVREWRELVRYRAKLVALRAGLKAQVHAVLAKRGVHVPMTDLFGVGGRQLLAHLCETDTWFHSAFGQRIESLLELIDAFSDQVTELNTSIAAQLGDHAGYQAIQQIPGIGPTIAAILVAEIGDVSRFRSAAHLAVVVRAHPTPPRIRHDDPTRSDHQTRLQARALGGDRSRAEAAQGLLVARRTRTHRRTTQQPPDRQDSNRSQDDRARLLRTTRRPHPLSPTTRRRVNTTNRGQAASAAVVMTPSPAGVVVHLIAPT